MTESGARSSAATSKNVSFGDLSNSVRTLLVIATPFLIVAPAAIVGFIAGLIWLGMDVGFTFGKRFDSWVQKFDERRRRNA